jgi:hypothetical protein
MPPERDPATGASPAATLEDVLCCGASPDRL